jgi:hypothetical protein
VFSDALFDHQPKNKLGESDRLPEWGKVIGLELGELNAFGPTLPLTETAWLVNRVGELLTNAGHCLESLASSEEANEPGLGTKRRSRGVDLALSTGDFRRARDEWFRRVTREQTLCGEERFRFPLPARFGHFTAMLSRRAFQMLAPATALELCLTTVPRLAGALPARELFTLARNTNANVLKYAVRTGRDGRLDRGNPIEAYWLMFAENGRREELTWTERRFAYGFSTSNSSDHGCSLRLTACPERELRVRAVDGGYRAEATIARQASVLKRIFVFAEPHTLLPSVRYVEISGINAGGKLVSERLLPERVSHE